MKFVRILTGIMLAVLFTVQPVLAEEKPGLSEAKKGSISQNCSSIRQSLKNLQRVDSRIRVLLGTSYNTILTNFITPLNLRLVRDNKPNVVLSNLQSDFAGSKDTFSKRFISYSQSMEELVAMDCKNNPEGFYNKLIETRKLRINVTESVNEMRGITNRHIETIQYIKNSLKKEANDV